MSNLGYEIQDHIGIITIQREAKHNAFDELLLAQLQEQLTTTLKDPAIRVLILKAQGDHFSAGADLAWMQRMANYSRNENEQDALVLAKVMNTLYQSPIPTIAMVQGCAYGGGAGLVAACDIAIAAANARFCFSEVKLGLIPAVISPYVIKAIGERAAKALFMSAEIVDAQRALELHLIHHCVPDAQLFDFTLHYAQTITKNAPEAVKAAKQLVNNVANQPIDAALIRYTAELIAEKRISAEGQQGLHAFLNKNTPNWN